MDKLFGFEESLAKSLGCIPMAVRRKLDLVGIKLSLPQWTAFPVETRRTLLETPLGVDAADWECLLVEALAARQELPRRLEKDPRPEWTDGSVVPSPVVEQCRAHGVGISVQTWSALPELSRFALCKLSRAGHENKNFPAAAEEFGL